MAAKEVKKATVNLSCPVCYQVFKNPKYLPCYHSYCEECLEKMVKQSKITCPECRKEAIIPAGGVKELASNFFVNRMVDEFILKRKVDGEEDVRCENCDEDDPVVAYCPDCSFFLCHLCNEVHKRAKTSRSHGIVPLTELRANKDAPLQVQVKIPLCQEHDEQLKYYCGTCERLVCMYCTVKDHNGHDHDTVKKMASKHRQELKEITAPVEEMIASLSEAHDNIDKMRVKIRQQGDKVNERIDQHYDKLVQKLMTEKEEFKQQVHDTVSQKEKAVTLQINEVEYAQAEMLSLKELKDALEKSSDQEALSAKKQVIDRMQKLTCSFKKLNTQPAQSATMEFAPIQKPFQQCGKLHTHIDITAFDIKNIPNQITVGQRVEFTIITKYSTGHPCSTGGSQVSVQVQSSTGEMTATQVRDNNDGSYIASFVIQQIGEVKVSVCINGHQIHNCQLKCTAKLVDYTAIENPWQEINSLKMHLPWGIAFGKDGVWAVPDFGKHLVYIFDGQDQLINEIGGKCDAQFDTPSGVAFDSNYLYIVEHKGQRIQKIDTTDSKVLLQFTGKGTDGQLNNPRGITIHFD